MNKLHLNKTSAGYYASYFGSDNHKVLYTIQSHSVAVISSILNELGVIDYELNESEFIRI